VLSLWALFLGSCRNSIRLADFEETKPLLSDDEWDLLTNMQVIAVMANLTSQINSMGKYKLINFCLAMIIYLGTFLLYVYAKCDFLDEYFEVLIRDFKFYFIILSVYVVLMLTNMGLNKEFIK
jgi:hypothetical protein